MEEQEWPAPIARFLERAEAVKDRITARLPPVPEPVQRVLDRIQDLTARLIAWAQPIVVTVLLVFVYILGIGATWLWCQLFQRERLRVAAAVETDGSFWRDASGYEPDPVRLHKQI